MLANIKPKTEEYRNLDTRDEVATFKASPKNRIKLKLKVVGFNSANGAKNDTPIEDLFFGENAKVNIITKVKYKA